MFEKEKRKLQFLSPGKITPDFLTFLYQLNAAIFQHYLDKSQRYQPICSVTLERFT